MGARTRFFAVALCIVPMVGAAYAGFVASTFDTCLTVSGAREEIKPEAAELVRLTEYLGGLLGGSCLILDSAQAIRHYGQLFKAFNGREPRLPELDLVEGNSRLLIVESYRLDECKGLAALKDVAVVEGKIVAHVMHYTPPSGPGTGRRDLCATDDIVTFPVLVPGPAPAATDDGRRGLRGRGPRQPAVTAARRARFGKKTRLTTWA